MSGPQLTEVGTLMQKSIARRPLPTPPTKTATPTQPATSTASTGGAKPLPTPPPNLVDPRLRLAKPPPPGVEPPFAPTTHEPEPSCIAVFAVSPALPLVTPFVFVPPCRPIWQV